MSYKFKHPRGRISEKPETENTLGWDIFKSALEGRVFIPICKVLPQEADEKRPNTVPCEVSYRIKFEEECGHTLWALMYQCPTCNHVVYHKGSILNVPGIDMVSYCTMLLRKYMQDNNTQLCSVCVGYNKLDLDGMVLDGPFTLIDGVNGPHLVPKQTIPKNLPQCGLFYFQANAWSPEQGICVGINQKCTAEELTQYCTVRMMSGVIDPGFVHEVQKNRPNSSDIRNWLVELKPNLTLTLTLGSSTVRCFWDGFTVKSSVDHKFG
jgi:hypothetical protein